MDDFLTKYGHERKDFFVKIGKKSYTTDFYGPKYSFDRLDVFWPNIGITAASFSWKIFKTWHEIIVFYSMNVFLQKRGMRARHFLENGLFTIKYVHESSYIFMKKKKKWPFCLLLWSIIYLSIDRIDVFWLNMGLTAGVFHEKFEKKWHECILF